MTGTVLVTGGRAAVLGSPEEWNDCAWLLDPEASYVTGAVLDVTGGR